MTIPHLSRPLSLVLFGLGVGSTSLGLGVAASACSDSTDPVGGGDSSVAETGPKDSGAADTSTGGEDAGAVNGCTTFLDRSAESASRTLTWDFSISTSTERCMKIKAGQKVKFGDGAGGIANFGLHPVEPLGGDTPNPGAGLDLETGEVTFPNAGTFGFVCGTHPAMLGAFSVVP